MSPPCSTFSASRATFRGPRPVRSQARPRGLKRLTASDRAIQRNIFADFSFDVARVAMDWVLEQPSCRLMRLTPRQGTAGACTRRPGRGYDPRLPHCGRPLRTSTMVAGYVPRGDGRDIDEDTPMVHPGIGYGAASGRSSSRRLVRLPS